MSCFQDMMVLAATSKWCICERLCLVQPWQIFIHACMHNYIIQLNVHNGMM